MLQDPLLTWYDRHQRTLPWRATQDQSPNPYHVLLSEVMLQQTTVATVKGYFDHFISRWPRLENLAEAPLEDVYHAWQGLGYYSRAKNLHSCVKEVMGRFQGTLPSSEEDLLTLPGIGPYTASAIAAIAFEQPTVPVDGNIVRVFSRLYAIKTPLPGLKDEIYQFVKKFIPTQRRGDFAQALMDLGATICKPRNPLCLECPMRSFCQAHLKAQREREFREDMLPVRAKKKAKPKKSGVVFWYESPQGGIWIRKRPPTGLLANLMEFPGTSWSETPLTSEEALLMAPISIVPWDVLPQTVEHIFTHFHLSLKILKGKGEEKIGDFACPVDEFQHYAFPTLMKKVIQCIEKS